MTQATAEPLIYTSKGNVPAASLTLETAWDVQDSYIKIALRYRDASGELVREDAHVYCNTGMTGDGSVTSVG